MAKAVIKNDDGTSVKFLATQDYECGEIVQVAGLVGVVEGLSGVKTGEWGNARIKAHAELPKADATDFTEGDAVQFNFGTGLSVASGGIGAGKAVRTTAENATSVLVLLNE